MAIAHMYEDFSQPMIAENELILRRSDVEEEKLKAFETGYSAGWEDAKTAHDQSLAALTESTKSALASLDAARVDAAKEHSLAVRDLTDALLKQVFPTYFGQSLPEHIGEEISKSLVTQADLQIEVHVSQGDLAAVQDFISEHIETPCKIATDPSLGAGQAYLQLGEAERWTDLPGLVSQISKIFDEYFCSLEEEAPHE